MSHFIKGQWNIKKVCLTDQFAKISFKGIIYVTSKRKQLIDTWIVCTKIFMKIYENWKFKVFYYIRPIWKLFSKQMFLYCIYDYPVPACLNKNNDCIFHENQSIYSRNLLILKPSEKFTKPGSKLFGTDF